MQAEKSEIRHSARDSFGHVLMTEQYRLLVVEVPGKSVAVQISNVEWTSTSYNKVSRTLVY